ncbi:DUF6544 family protein [Acidobacteriota bacterium]
MKVVLIILGVVAGLIAMITGAGSIGYLQFRARVKREAADLFKNKKEASAGIVTEEDLVGLPEPVQRYLRHTQIIGKERIHSVRLKMKGQFRLKPEQRWFSLKAEEYYTTDPPALVWFGKISPLPLFPVTARDKYFSGKGNMRVKLLSLFPVADESGEEIDKAAIVRYLNEIFWFPTAYLGKNIKWTPVDENSARVSISDAGTAVSALCFFNENGELINFVADRAYVIGETKEWHTPIHEYKEFNGIRVPFRGEALYKLSSGDFSYIKAEITNIEYNVSSPY